MVVHDEDPLPTRPGDWSEDRIKQRRRTCNENTRIADALDKSLGRVEVLSPDFEGVAGVSRTAGEKVGKAMAAMDWVDEQEDRQVPVRLREVVAAGFAAGNTVRLTPGASATVPDHGDFGNGRLRLPAGDPGAVRHDDQHPDTGTRDQSRPSSPEPCALLPSSPSP